MKYFNPDSYCGIYCGSCSIAMYAKTGCADKFATCLGGVPKEELICGGCKSDDVYAGCGACILRGCAREKNVEHCINCTDYPCTRYSKWQSLAKFLPHIHESATSLETIRRDGIDQWLDEQKKRWLCPDCGTPFSWYASACNKCGHSLELKAYTLSRWKKLLCHFILPMAYRKGKAKQNP